MSKFIIIQSLKIFGQIKGNGFEFQISSKLKIEEKKLNWASAHTSPAQHTFPPRRVVTARVGA
jgi:hypothetical protein